MSWLADWLYLDEVENHVESIFLFFFCQTVPLAMKIWCGNLEKKNWTVPLPTVHSIVCRKAPVSERRWRWNAECLSGLHRVNLLNPWIHNTTSTAGMETFWRLAAIPWEHTEKKNNCAGRIWLISSQVQHQLLTVLSRKRLGNALACALKLKSEESRALLFALNVLFFQAWEQADVHKRKTAVVKFILLHGEWTEYHHRYIPHWMWDCYRLAYYNK